MTYTLLAVDDEPANLRMLERLFRREYRVLTANNGEEALELLGREDVALIITDQRMPGMSGTELLRKTLQTRPETVRIILTGYTDVDSLTDAINTTRVYKFVSKPWDPTMLEEIVRDAIREHEECIQQKQLVDSLVQLLRTYPILVSRIAGQDEAGNPTDSVFSSPATITN
jgi:response regulator RpfG family c-di-GMP phosphodiesterase